MAKLGDKVILDKPGRCPDCEQDTIWDVYSGICRRCHVIRYAGLRQVLNWPPDALMFRMLRLTEEEFWAILSGGPHPRPGP